MPIRRIFGYIGFVISLPIAFYFIKVSGGVGIGMIGLDIIIYALLIIIAVTTIFYIVGRVIEKNRRGTTMK